MHRGILASQKMLVAPISDADISIFQGISLWHFSCALTQQFYCRFPGGDVKLTGFRTSGQIFSYFFRIVIRARLKFHLTAVEYLTKSTKSLFPWGDPHDLITLAFWSEIMGIFPRGY